MNDILTNLWVRVYDKGELALSIFVSNMDKALLVIDALPRKRNRTFKIF